MILELNYWLGVGCAFIIFWRLPFRIRMYFVATTSFALLIFLDLVGTWVLLALTIACYFAAPHCDTQTRRGKWLARGIVGALVANLAYFKFIPGLFFATASVQRSAEDFLIPLGISYYTFKLIHYVVEASRSKLTDHAIDSFLAYIFLYPIFTAGPIERFDHFVNQREEKWQLAGTAYGLTRIVHGLIKRFVLVDLLYPGNYLTVGTAQQLVARIYVLPTHEVWAFLLLTYWALYMEFSAYSDVAIGTSRLFGLRIMENFNFPILASNISEFWKRWHMTLAGWCQTYVYLPLIGAARRPFLAIVTTFIVMGMWHSGSLQWLSWGIYHGLGVYLYLVWSRFRRRRFAAAEHWVLRVLGVLLTNLYVAAAGAFVALGENATIIDSIRVFRKLVFILDLSVQQVFS